MNHLSLIATAVCVLAIVPQDVLGPCGTAEEDSPAAPAAATSTPLGIQPIPLPGQRALNFSLPAVVDGEIRTVKLSDYEDQWRVLCFYPADFTFV